MTPKILELALEGYRKRLETQAQLLDGSNYLLGRYIAFAVNSPKDYPDKPFLQKQKTTDLVPITEKALRDVAQALQIHKGIDGKHSNRRRT